MSLFDLVDSMPALGFISLIIAIIALIRSSQLESRLRELEDTLKRSGPERPQLKTRMGQTQPETTELAATATAPPTPL
ncbi:MAG: hypothetical protein PF961_04295, partial [Planctomycetota bacterium]|nr:hypothetical protein [Planctomycetota bacterium]